ncbi:MAG: hypothetical protein ACLUQW_06930 [Collinsella sp.]
MDKRDLEQLLRGVADGSVAPADALTRIQTAPTADLGFAQLDLSRGCVAGEVVCGAGKTVEQTPLSKRCDAARAHPGQCLTPKGSLHPGSTPASTWDMSQTHSRPRGRQAPYRQRTHRRRLRWHERRPVAEEAALTAEFYGNEVDRLYDVGAPACTACRACR